MKVKTTLLVLLFTSAIALFSQNDIESYKRGFHVGYCQARSNAMGLVDYMNCISPIPPIKVTRATYSQGVVDGTVAFSAESANGGNGVSVAKDNLSFLLNQPSVPDPTRTVSSDAFIQGLQQGAASAKPDLYYYYLESMPPVVEVVINKMSDALKDAEYIVIERVDGSTNYYNKKTCEEVLSQLFTSNKIIASLVNPKINNKLIDSKSNILNKSQYLFVSITTDYLSSNTMGLMGKVVFKSKDIWRTILIEDAGGNLVYKARFLNVNVQHRYKHMVDPSFDFSTVYPQD